MVLITPFKLVIPEEKLLHLKQKLALADILSNFDDREAWIHGPPSSNINRLTQYCAHNYDGGKAEAQINELSQLAATVDEGAFCVVAGKDGC